MRFKIIHLAPATSDTRRPTPRWALRLAYALPLVLLPTCLWRLPFAFGFTMGEVHQAPVHPGLGTLWVTIPYVFSLSLLSEAAALLSIGLVRRWGEVAPKRLPLIGGRPIPPAAVLVPATLAGLALTGVSVDLVLGWTGVIHGPGFTNPWWQVLAGVCIAPTALWGPILLALSHAYYARRSRPERDDLPTDSAGGSAGATRSGPVLRPSGGGDRSGAVPSRGADAQPRGGSRREQRADRLEA